MPKRKIMIHTLEEPLNDQLLWDKEAEGPLVWHSCLTKQDRCFHAASQCILGLSHRSHYIRLDWGPRVGGKMGGYINKPFLGGALCFPLLDIFGGLSQSWAASPSFFNPAGRCKEGVKQLPLPQFFLPAQIFSKHLPLPPRLAHMES